jgi:hypothetical protein
MRILPSISKSDIGHDVLFGIPFNIHHSKFLVSCRGRRRFPKAGSLLFCICHFPSTPVSRVIRYSHFYLMIEDFGFENVTRWCVPWACPFDFYFLATDRISFLRPYRTWGGLVHRHVGRRCACPTLSNLALSGQSQRSFLVAEIQYFDIFDIRRSKFLVSCRARRRFPKAGSLLFCIWHSLRHWIFDIRHSIFPCFYLLPSESSLTLQAWLLAAGASQICFY